MNRTGYGETAGAQALPDRVINRVARPPTRGGEVPHFTSALSSSIEEVSATVDDLAARLAGVLMPSPPTADGQAQIHETPSSPLGEALHGSLLRVRNIGYRVDDLIRRLQV